MANEIAAANYSSNFQFSLEHILGKLNAMSPAPHEHVDTWFCWQNREIFVLRKHLLISDI